MPAHMYSMLCVYIYIYIERERCRDRYVYYYYYCWSQAYIMYSYSNPGRKALELTPPTPRSSGAPAAAHWQLSYDTRVI